MAYNTKPIVADKDGNPISQYYNKELDQYEPVEGGGGGNKVVLYNADGTENNSLSLIEILDKLSQLTGTVIDEETRKSNELLRIELYNQISQMLINGDLKGDKGDIGLGLEYDWNGTQLGVRVEGDTEYIYVDLKGPKGDKGETGDMENLNAQHIEDALGYVPADEDIIGMLESLTTDEKANLVAAINEVKSQSNEMATDKLDKVGGTVTGNLEIAGILTNKGKTVATTDKIDVLWSGSITISTTPTQITLTKNIKDYNYIEVGIGGGGTDLSSSATGGTVVIKDFSGAITTNVYRGFISNNEIRYKAINDNTIEMVCASGTIPLIRQIKGIKAGG